MYAGCRLWGLLQYLLQSWFQKDWSEAAEVAVTGRWFQSLILIVRGGRTGWLVCS